MYLNCRIKNCRQAFSTLKSIKDLKTHCSAAYTAPKNPALPVQHGFINMSTKYHATPAPTVTGSLFTSVNYANTREFTSNNDFISAFMDTTIQAIQTPARLNRSCGISYR